MIRNKYVSFAFALFGVAVLVSSCSSPLEPGLEVSLDDSTKYCELNVQKSPAVLSTQSVAILAPTNNFVDFETVVTRSETTIKESLGGSLPSSELKSAIGREFSVVLADGNPRMLAKRSVQPAGTSDYDIKSAIDSSFGVFRLANKCVAGTLKRPNDNVPSAQGSDMLKALSVASDQLTTDGARKIYILGNGIQTEGAIQMQNPGLFPKTATSAKLLAQGLKGIGEIPDLRGAEIYWYGLGQVDGSNQQLSENAAKSLESFWVQIIEYGGGIVKEVCAKCGAGFPHQFAISVPTFEVPTCTLVRLYEEDGVEFEPDTANFTDITKAKSAAKQMSSKFTGSGCDEMVITGFAAAGVDKPQYQTQKSEIDATNKALTKKRAAAFAQLVRAAGYKGAISSAGGGTCGTEWSGSGSVDLDLQRLCRRVEVSN
jgi:hypothetical protein